MTEADGETTETDEGWPVLSDVELDVRISESVPEAIAADAEREMRRTGRAPRNR